MDKVRNKNKKNNKSANNGQPNSTSTATDLKFAQINLQHCKKATYSYCRDLTVEQTDFSLIQESWVRGQKIHGFGQLNNRLFYYRTGVRPRVLYTLPRT